MWPREAYRDWELFPLDRSLKFGPLTGVTGPRTPVLLLKRAFGDDCFEVYYRSASHASHASGGGGGGGGGSSNNDDAGQSAAGSEAAGAAGAEATGATSQTHRQRRREERRRLCRR